ncbi:MAG: alpha/beta hydrolase fold protein [Myxococcaceae bacterium]|nr:alpha/beta hydrolase fold protein [Myxococcaceae bacterium]
MPHAALQHAPAPDNQLLALAVGPMRVRRHGPAGAPLAIGVPGLSANSFTFDALGAGLARQGRGLAALDLRGRGRSPAGVHGSHGWKNHARDVIAVADALGVDRFDFVGHSMGAFIGLVLANLAPARLRRLVLIDAVGVPDPRAMPPIFAAVNRLGTVHPSPEAFLSRVRAAGVVPWGPFWEAHYREDLVEVPGGVAQRASQAAVLEDMGYAAGTQVRELWSGVGVATLLVRAAIPLAPGGDVVTAADRNLFLDTAPRARVVEIEANHYGVMNHPDTARAVEEFLR